MVEVGDFVDGDESDQLVEEVGAVDVDASLRCVRILDLANELFRASMGPLGNEEVEPARSA